jgi:hypothetical protein
MTTIRTSQRNEGATLVITDGQSSVYIAVPEGPDEAELFKKMEQRLNAFEAMRTAMMDMFDVKGATPEDTTALLFAASVAKIEDEPLGQLMECFAASLTI